jgi:hypothetical protein
MGLSGIAFLPLGIVKLTSIICHINNRSLTLRMLANCEEQNETKRGYLDDFFPKLFITAIIDH